MVNLNAEGVRGAATHRQTALSMNKIASAPFHWCVAAVQGTAPPPRMQRSVPPRARKPDSTPSEAAVFTAPAPRARRRTLHCLVHCLLTGAMLGGAHTFTPSLAAGGFSGAHPPPDRARSRRPSPRAPRAASAAASHHPTQAAPPCALMPMPPRMARARARRRLPPPVRRTHRRGQQGLRWLA